VINPGNAASCYFQRFFREDFQPALRLAGTPFSQ